MAENGVSGYGNVTTQFTILVVSDDGSLANDTSNIVMVNNTTNVTWSQSSNWNPDDLIFTALTSTILGILIFATVVGNVFVIAAILLERHLHSVANYLIVSLAVADLLVACLVMPLGAVYEISRKWILGPELCDMWTSSDVLCCTASILHLVAIAVDRYWAVTNIDYIRNRNIQRIGTMIFLIWTVALVVSIAPLFGWKDPEFIHRVNVQQRCLVSQDVAYQVFATCATFYVPLTVILMLYWKIFQTARRRIRRKPGNSPHENRPEKSCFSWSTIARPVMDTKARKGHPPSRERGNCHEELPPSHVLPQVVPSKTAESSLPEEQQQTTAFTIEMDAGALKPNNGTSSLTLLQDRETRSTSPCPTSAADSSSDPRKRRETLESKREKKAAKTLAIITGAFVVCWMPFFTCALLMPLCPTWEFNETMLSVFLWLGYFNSTLNPIIYTIFSPEFRQAFQRLLCGRPLQASVYQPRKLH